jgi:hypothetical protein
VANYLISWEYTGPCSIDTQSFLLGGEDTSRELVDLEEAGVFIVRLFALNSAGRGPAAESRVQTLSSGMS